MYVHVKVYIGKGSKKNIFNKAYDGFIHMLSFVYQHFSVAADALDLKD